MEERRWGHALPLFAAVAAVAGIGMVSHYRASAAQLELTAMTTMLGFEDIPLAPPPEPPPGAAGPMDAGAAPPDIQSAVATASPDDIAAMMGSV
jgi:hypothetical protein